MRLYKHYSDVNPEEWRWKDFSPREIASKREGELGVDPEAMDTLQRMRDLLGAPIRITSGYRSKAHNRAVGGASRSQHLLGKAFDIQVEGHDPAQLLAAGVEAGFTTFVFYQKQGFIHFDIRSEPARWGKQWFKSQPLKRETVKPSSWLTILANFINRILGRD